MKKMLVILAFGAMAAVANAAATSWALTAGQMFDHTGSAFTGTLELYASGGDLAQAVAVFSETPAALTYNKKAFDVNELTAGTSYDFYLVLKDGDYTFTSATKTVTALATGSAAVAFGSLKTATQNASNWQTQGTPEPTSGLLLLVGLAGLALKRKNV